MMKLPVALSLLAVAFASPTFAKQKSQSATTSPQLKVESYFGPGFQFFRAAQDLLSSDGLLIELTTIEGNWLEAAPAFQKKKLRAGLLKGTSVTTSTTRLSSKEKSLGLAEIPLGYYGAVLVAHPEAPIKGVDKKKWQVASKASPNFAWEDIAPESEIADAAAMKATVTWVLPDKGYQEVLTPLERLGAISPKILSSLPAVGPQYTPLVTTYAVADDKNRIAIHGYNLVINHQIHPLKPVRLLEVDGVYPNERTIADGSYPFSNSVSLIYSAKAATDPNSPIARLLTFLQSPRANEVRRIRSLVAPAIPGRVASQGSDAAAKGE